MSTYSHGSQHGPSERMPYQQSLQSDHFSAGAAHPLQNQFAIATGSNQPSQDLVLMGHSFQNAPIYPEGLSFSLDPSGASVPPTSINFQQFSNNLPHRPGSQQLHQQQQQSRAHRRQSAAPRLTDATPRSFLSDPSGHPPVMNMSSLTGRKHKRQKTETTTSSFQSVYTSNRSHGYPPSLTSHDSRVSDYQVNSTYPSNTPFNAQYLQPQRPQHLETRSNYSSASTTTPSQQIPPGTSLKCEVCSTPFTKQCDLTKHKQKHDKSHLCLKPGCDRAVYMNGFTTANDLLRHEKTVHDILRPRDVLFVCPVPTCTTNVYWNRWDNFRQHVVRMHEREITIPKAELNDYLKHNYSHEYLGTAETTTAEYVRLQQAQKPTNEARHIPSNENQKVEERAFNVRKFDEKLMQLSTRPDAQPIDHRYKGRKRPRSGEDVANRGQYAKHPALHRVPRSVQGFPHDQHSFFLSPSMVSNARPSIQNNISSRNFDTSKDAVTVSGHEPWPDQPNPFVEDVVTFVQPAPADAVLAGAGTHMENNIMQMDHSLNGFARELSVVQETDSEEDTLAQSLDGDLKFAFDRVIASGFLPPDISRAVAKVRKEIPSAPKSTTTDLVAPKGKSLKRSTSVGGKIYKCDFIGTNRNGTDEPCRSSFDKKNELNKHARRHQRLFGCIFDGCDKKFGSKWEWKRHEFKLHEQQQCWRCDQVTDGRTCAAFFADKNEDNGSGKAGKNEFETHLRQEHNISEHRLAKLVWDCQVQYDNGGSFWCGYCIRVIQSQAKPGIPRETERFTHICTHVIGPDRRRPEEWIELSGGGRSKGQASQLSSMTLGHHNFGVRYNSDHLPSNSHNTEEEDDDDSNETDPGEDAEHDIVDEDHFDGSHADGLLQGASVPQYQYSHHDEPSFYQPADDSQQQQYFDNQHQIDSFANPGSFEEILSAMNESEQYQSQDGAM